MNLHEYQAKELFSQYQIAHPVGILVKTKEEATAAREKIGGKAWVVKAQIHSGGRGKVGAVRLAKSPAEFDNCVNDLLGKKIKTLQSGSKELPINSLLIEETLEIKKEFYLSALIDRSTEKLTFIASKFGGMDIEEVAKNNPQDIIKVAVNPSSGYFPYVGRKIAFALDLTKEAGASMVALAGKIYKLFLEKDLSLLEINPLILNENNQLIALDAKINLDDNALFRQKELALMYDQSQEDSREEVARDLGLNYVALDGNIGCMVNGAGLAMATMDIVKLHGGSPANFLDVGGSTTAERVKEAFKLILSSPEVKAILVNIFGGIVRCDLIAEGIIGAAQEIGLKIPVVVRLQGTNVDLGRKLLNESGLSIVAVDDLNEAAKKVVELAR